MRVNSASLYAWHASFICVPSHIICVQHPIHFMCNVNATYICIIHVYVYIICVYNVYVTYICMLSSSSNCHKWASVPNAVGRHQKVGGPDLRCIARHIFAGFADGQADARHLVQVSCTLILILVVHTRMYTMYPCSVSVFWRVSGI